MLGAGAGPVAGGVVLPAGTTGISIGGEGSVPTRRAPPVGVAPGVGIGAGGIDGPPDGLLGEGGAPAGGVTGSGGVSHTGV